MDFRPDSRRSRPPSFPALTLDADNTSARHEHAIFEEIVKLGEANVRRNYGDFALPAGTSRYSRSRSLQHQQRSNTTGKNAADIALVIGAMDLIAQGQARRLLPRQFRQ